ncbi:hypothetical protein GBAR_LOCUS13515 [Geodia barretti]|uniref:Uncharacterized protein n=1 Tax=Geodia barretti TaxID=519541 RepID=A0AA35S432_GEOBA|nr:hypothetical protein GBAR_LOCUS13515 [Geodia barretti]
MATDMSESEIEDLSVSSKTSGPSLKETLSGFITTPFSSVLVLQVKDHHYLTYTICRARGDLQCYSKRGRGRAKPRSVSRARATSGGSDAKEEIQTTGHGLTRGGQERGRGRGCGTKTGSGRGRGRGSTLTPAMATDKSESEIEDVSVSSKTSGPSLKETLSEPEVTSNTTVKRGRGRAKPRSVSRSRGTSGGSVPKVSNRKTYPLRFASRKASQGL